jgi:hypothetical protein
MAFMILCSLTACGKQSNTEKSQEITQQSQQTETQNKDTQVDKSLPEVKVIFDFADNVNGKLYEKALADLTDSLAGVYSMENNAPMRNTTHMDIKEIADKTSEWDTDDNTIKSCFDKRIYYVAIQYKISNIIDSAFKDDSIYYHKVITVREKKDSPWKIAEMSGAPGYNQ